MDVDAGSVKATAALKDDGPADGTKNGVGADGQPAPGSGGGLR